MKTPFRAYDGTDNTIFVSYAHKDAADVYPAIEALNARGFRLWYDEGIEAGADWADAIGTSLEKASVVLAFLSKNFIASENCLREIAFAEAHDIPVVSVSVGDVTLPDDLARKLTVHQITDMTGSATYGELADTLAPSLDKYGTNRGETFAYEDKKITLAKKKQTVKTGLTLLTVLAAIAIVTGIVFGVLYKQVPDVIGYDAEIAEAMLESAGFRSTVSLNYSEEYPFGVIIDQSSTGKTFKFIPVVITQSIGSKEDLTDVPDTVGDHVSDGVSKMITAGLKKFSLSEDNETNKGTEQNHIASQSIPAGLRVSKNNAVSLGVATDDGTVTFEQTVGKKAIRYKVYVGIPVLITIDDRTQDVIFEYEDGTVTVDRDGNTTVKTNGGSEDEITKRLTVTNSTLAGNGDTNTGNNESNGDRNGGDSTGNNDGTGDGNTQSADGNEGNGTTGDTGNDNTGDNDRTGDGNTQSADGNEGNGNTGDTGNDNTGDNDRTGNEGNTENGDGNTETVRNSALLRALGLDTMSDDELAEVKAVTLIGTQNLSPQFDLYNPAATPDLTAMYGNSIQRWNPDHSTVCYSYNLFDTGASFGSVAPGTLNDLSDLAKLPNLEVLILDGQNISDITPILALTNLRRLSLNCNPLSSIAGIEALTNLEYLSLTDTNVSDISPALSCPKLVSLGLDRTRVTSLAGTDRLPNLRNISFRLTGVSAMPRFANGSYVSITANQVYFTDISGLATVSSFNKLQLDNVTAADLIPYVTGKPIDGLFWAGDKGVATLGELAAISARHLDVCMAGDLVSLDGCERLTATEILNLKGCTAISDLTPLLNMPNLRMLMLYTSQSELVSQLDGSAIEIVYDGD